MSNATEMAYGNRTDFAGSESRFSAGRSEAFDQPVDHKQNMGRAEAWISAGVGGILVGSALRRRSRASLPLTAVGAFLFYRGVTRHCPGYAAAGIDRSERRSGPDAVSVITINKPVEAVYRVWRNLNNLPQFMNAVESVRTDQPSRCMSQVQVDVPVIDSGSPLAIDQSSSRTCRVARPVPGCSKRPVSS